MTPTRLSATPWKRRTQFPLGFFGRTFQPRRGTRSGARASKSSWLAPVTATEASAWRMRSGVNSRRMGWRNARPENQPARAARSGGKSNKIRAMRMRPWRIRAYAKIRGFSQSGSGDASKACRQGVPPCLLSKSAESIENKRVEFVLRAEKCKKCNGVRMKMKKDGIGGRKWGIAVLQSRYTLPPHQ